MVGIVQGPSDEEVPEDVLRDILEVLDSEPILTSDQLRLWRWIADYYMCPIGNVMAAALPAKAIDRQYSLDIGAKRRVKMPTYDGPKEPLHPLDQQQDGALGEILDDYTKHRVTLLHGVTSSGKTEVYTHLIQRHLDRGEQVLYLVPEIALTTQLTDRLQRVFGDQLYVYHSRIADGQRMELYRQLLIDDHHEGRVIVGARSAVFLPIRRLGLIILDEEHEPSYKQQDPAPRYHARSVAVIMAGMANAHVVMGTATPAIETYHNALTGKYGLVRMKERYRGLQLPRIGLIDLQRQYHRKEMYDHFADPLVEQITRQLEAGKQVILFQNRRGYAPYIQCTGCGYVPTCPDCDARTTLHMREHALICHYCGRTEFVPSTCPQCGGEMKIHGFGTEKLEEECAKLFPTARVERMDWDTTRHKDDYQSIIDRFARHEVDILIGTQMVSKGLHFDDVSLVAVLNADALLNQPSFRATERAFQMLEQVSGRAGRKGTQGQVLIQTYDPKHPIYHTLALHNYDELYDRELADRKLFHYPPFTRLITLTLKHKREDRLMVAAEAMHGWMVNTFADRCSPVIIPSMARLQTYYLRQIHLKIETGVRMDDAKRLLMEGIHWVESLQETKGIIILPDVDPLS